MIQTTIRTNTKCNIAIVLDIPIVTHTDLHRSGPAGRGQTVTRNRRYHLVRFDTNIKRCHARRDGHNVFLTGNKNQKKTSQRRRANSGQASGRRPVVNVLQRQQPLREPSQDLVLNNNNNNNNSNDDNIILLSCVLVSLLSSL